MTAAEDISSKWSVHLRRLRNLGPTELQSLKMRWSGTVRGGDDRRQTLSEASAQSPKLPQTATILCSDRDRDFDR
jgi:hypothetical protein